MKTRSSLILSIAISLLSLVPLKILAQNHQKSDSVFVLMKKYINEKNTSLIYSLAATQYKTAVSEQNLHAFFEREIYPLGKIKQSAFNGFHNTKSKYKLIFESGKLDLYFSLDKNGKFDTLTFLPFKPQISNKPLAVASSNSLKSALDKQVDSIARQYIQKSNTVGLSIGVFKNGQVQTYGYGETQRGKGEIPHANTIFEIGSITKTFTSVILAYYVNAGKIKLTDPVAKYLPDSVTVNPELKKISIAQLSNHTSGLASLPTNLLNKNMDRLNPYKGYNQRMFFASLKIDTLKSVPGEVYAYSNQAVGLLGVILERISGKTYEQLVKQLITDPLKMSSTTQQITPPQTKRFVKVYDADGDETKAWDFDALAACGALHSTVNDLLLYAKANIECPNPVLSKSFELSHQITFSKGPIVGLGWHVTQLNGDNYYWHNGGTGGSRSFIVFNIEKKAAVVVLSNASVSVDDIAWAIAKL